MIASRRILTSWSKLFSTPPPYSSAPNTEVGRLFICVEDTVPNWVDDMYWTRVRNTRSTRTTPRVLSSCVVPSDEDHNQQTELPGSRLPIVRSISSNEGLEACQDLKGQSPVSLENLSILRCDGSTLLLTLTAQNQIRFCRFVANQTNFFRRFQAGLLKLSMVGVIDGPMLPADVIHANVNFTGKRRRNSEPNL